MAEELQNHHPIHAVVGRARRRWLVSAMINAGGRWALLPAGVGAVVGIVLALVGWTGWALMVAVAALGVLGVAAALGLARWFYGRSDRVTPQWTLLLDRALGLHDALPTWLECEGEFRPLIERRIAGGLDPERERHGAPPRHWGPLAAALVLALLPLAFMEFADDEPNEPQTVAEKDEPDENPPPPDPGGEAGGSGQSSKPGDSAGKDETSAGGADGGRGDEGEVRHRPDGEARGEGAGDPPDDTLPQEMKNDPKPQDGGAGNQDHLPTPAEPPEEPEIDSDLNRIRPDAGEGDTHTERRKRWVYDPQGEALDGSTPIAPDRDHPGERAVPRNKITTGERKTLRRIYEKLRE